MKWLSLAFVSFVILSCQKKIDVNSASINANVVENENGVYIESCHATSFITSYPTVAGKVPPFRFAKTHYSSGRVKTINMLSRANPNHSNFKQQAWEVIGAWTYNLKDEAYFVGTKQLWEYYKTSSGAAGKKAIGSKKNMKLIFRFYKDKSNAATFGAVNYVINELDNQDWTLWFPSARDLHVGQSSDEPALAYSAIGNNPLVLESQKPDWNGTPTDYNLKKKITFKFNASAASGMHSYQPTQNWISMEYTLVEVMGWLPSGFYPKKQRTSVAVEFYTSPTNKVVQSQIYKNHKYDASGKLMSYTYADNILQKTTWICK